MGRLLGWLMLVALVAAGGLYAASPWLAFHNLKQAAASGDTDRLTALIDAGAVREGLKGQIDSEVTKAARAAARVGFTPVEVAGKAGSMWGDRKVQKQIRPERLAELTAGEAHLAYLTPDAVRISVTGSPRGPARLLMERRSLFGWTLTRITLPGEKA